MSFLAKIEAICAAFIERAFAKSFPSDVEPAQIARKLVATMEAGTRGDDRNQRTHSSYAVYVSPKDFERLARHREYLERAWSELLHELAAKVGVALGDGTVHVAMFSRESLPLGAIAIEAGEEPQPVPKFRLRMVEGVPPKGIYAIEGTVRIGRSEESEIVLVDPSVSRAHALLEIGPGEPIVRDLNSTNGTFLNGRRVAAEPLRDGDELLFGNTKMRFESA